MANAITVCRMVFSVALLFLPAGSYPFWILFSLCALSDVADGYTARKTHTESKTGEMLDSIADLLFAAVSSVKLLPVILPVRWLCVWICVIAVLRIINFILGLARCGKPIFLHTAWNKATGVLLVVTAGVMCVRNVGAIAVPVCLVATVAAISEGVSILQKPKEYNGDAPL